MEKQTPLLLLAQQVYRLAASRYTREQQLPEKIRLKHDHVPEVRTGTILNYDKTRYGTEPIMEAMCTGLEHSTESTLPQYTFCLTTQDNTYVLARQCETVFASALAAGTELVYEQLPPSENLVQPEEAHREALQRQIKRERTRRRRELQGKKTG